MRAAAVLLSFLVGCTTFPFSEEPKPDPVRLAPPAAPPAKPGEIRIFGHELPDRRARAIRSRLREAETNIVAAYEEILATDRYAGGLLQLRIDINAKGEVAEIKPIEADINNFLIGREIDSIVRRLEFGPGAEAYAFHTMEFIPDPFEILGVRPELDGDHPTLVADVVNRTTFHLKNVAVYVSVQSPDQAAPLRVSKTRMRAPFKPGGRRTLRVPVKHEWATHRYTFLVDVRPSKTPQDDG